MANTKHAVKMVAAVDPFVFCVCNKRVPIHAYNEFLQCVHTARHQCRVGHGPPATDMQRTNGRIEAGQTEHSSHQFDHGRRFVGHGLGKQHIHRETRRGERHTRMAKRGAQDGVRTYQRMIFTGKKRHRPHCQCLSRLFMDGRVWGCSISYVHPTCGRWH